MLEERKHNAFAALDILARADSAAFERGRSDAAPRTNENQIAAHVRYNGHIIDTSFTKGSNGTKADYFVVTRIPGRFPTLEAAKEAVDSTRSDGLSAEQAKWTKSYDEAKARHEAGGSKKADAAGKSAKEYHAEGNRLTILAHKLKERGDMKEANHMMRAAEEQYKFADRARSRGDATGDWSGYAASYLRDIRKTLASDLEKARAKPSHPITDQGIATLTRQLREIDAELAGRKPRGRSDAESYISEAAAMRILRQEGDYSADQARIILNHSLKQKLDGHDYYPMSYIYKRAKG